MKPALLRYLLWSCLLLAVSCVTINIYFPAEEMRGAADRIVNEVWSERPGSPAAPTTPATPTPPPAGEKAPGSSFFHGWQPGVAYAAQDINVSTPEIRAIQASIKARSTRLFPYLDGGQVGIGNDGLLKLRTSDGLDLKARAEATRLVQAENDDRLRLYQEIARANGFPDKADEVQAIFADSWQTQASKGWYVEGETGSWSRK
ncbi:lipoprotein [Desulfuromonas sp. DDH964]|uniref:DUF1318 domain-containing protein n=1 Tax=Desulfuromonas sp. DDH964 TaxID=1823759 RepID=UPI00078B9849|nr:DUF1318 domain-containing protein [Desulfuromonas sp. DDH964]AMV71541.1 lipoprotein [Desulfuromonas sp. DDH964]